MVFLLPFNLAASAPHGWATGYIIAMIILGFAMMLLFCAHEYYWAPSPWLPWHFLTDRSMVGTCALNMVYQISYYTWNLYFQSFLQVVFNLSIAQAGYINNTFSVVSGVLLFLVGYAIRVTGLYRWLFYIAVPLYTFTLGLMIHFRQPNGNIGYIVMCEIFISIGGAVFILVCQLSVLSAVDHQHTSSAMSLSAAQLVLLCLARFGRMCFRVRSRDTCQNLRRTKSRLLWRVCRNSSVIRWAARRGWQFSWRMGMDIVGCWRPVWRFRV
jgi:hypothetical protein